MEGLINKDVESNDEGWKSWDDFENTNDDRNEWEYENEHEDNKRHELCGNETHELPVCNIRRFEMIKYSFGQDEEYVAVKENEYEDLTRPRCKEINDVGEVSTIWKSRSVGVLKSKDGCSTYILAYELNLENLPSKLSGSFSF
ncbi:hypothetical protein Tco_1355246 [Tanacetum coccineum]